MGSCVYALRSQAPYSQFDFRTTKEVYGDILLSLRASCHLLYLQAVAIFTAKRPGIDFLSLRLDVPPTIPGFGRVVLNAENYLAWRIQ